MHKLLATTVLLTLCAAAAQQVKPTSNGADAVKTGESTASVTQKVTLTLPKATALHLDTTELKFDISKLSTQSDGTWYCVEGTSGADVERQLDGDFWNQKQVLPMGTSYSPAKWPNITVNGGKQVTQYPPVDLVGGELRANSKNHFMCYRSFILQKFSNLGFFRLSVQRGNGAVQGDKKTQEGTFDLYIQDNPCFSFGEATGLYKLPVGGIRELIPRRLTVGTTGALAATNEKNCYGGGSKSWLDDLVIVAVKVDGDKFGDNTTTLTYTLESSESAFNDDGRDTK